MSGVPDRWLEIRVRVPDPAESAERIPELLVDAGGRATVEQDGWLVTHVPEPDDVDRFLAGVRSRFEVAGLSELRIESRWQAHEDWAETWKAGLAPRRITDRLVVRPSWTDFEAEPGDLVVVLDPGIAFGTAEHATTRGCLRLLDGAVQAGDSVLDVGSGSGILAVAAALLGAASVVCLEGDPYACEAARENAEANGVIDRIAVREAWADHASLAAEGPKDVVVANIETTLLRPLVPGLVEAVRPGGVLLLSGILEEEWPGMAPLLESLPLELDARDRDGEWCAGRFFKRPA